MTRLPQTDLLTSVQRVQTGLVGRDIQASRSPWLHEQEGAALGLDLSYTLFDFARSGRSEADLGRQLAEAEAAGFAGVNITHPYKQAVIGILHDLVPAAARIGAVNTVKFEAGKWIGHNTDVLGFAESLQRGLPGASLDRVAQFGCGGAGAATAHALLELGASQLVLMDPDRDRRQTLAAKLAAMFGADRVAVAAHEAMLTGANGVVNATPAGMVGYPATPFETDVLDPAQWVADIVYFPLETRLLSDARAKGCRTLDGSGMAVLQAAAAFDIFTGQTSDRDRMHKSFLAFIAKPAGQAA
jgi:shikimate dehydrogenase